MEELNAFHLTRYVEGKKDFEPLSDRAKAICKRLTDRAHQSDKLMDYDLLMTAVEVIVELQLALNGSGDGLTPDEPLNGNGK